MITWKDLADMRKLLDSIDFLEDSNEEAGYDLDHYYAKWNVKGSSIVIIMKRDCTIKVYKKGRSIALPNGNPGIQLPKLISLEEIISDNSLDKKDRTRLAWLIGQVDNGC